MILKIQIFQKRVLWNYRIYNKLEKNYFLNIMLLVEIKFGINLIPYYKNNYIWILESLVKIKKMKENWEKTI